VHQEETARLERVVARRQGRPPYDWQPAARHLVELPPGNSRLAEMYAPDATLDLEGTGGSTADDIVDKVGDLLVESAADGALLVEVRYGAGGQAFLHPEFPSLFREAERRVQTQYAGLRAEAIAFLSLWSEPARLQVVERQFAACLQRADAGLAGVDLRVNPYDTEADPALWAAAYGMAARAADAGLGITVHVGEFSAANINAALRTPGLTRLGHAVYAASDPRLLDALTRTGVTVECALSCNVILGAVPSYEAHPIRPFVACGIPVTLNTDDPVRICTTIGREYAIAHKLGFSPADLLGFTRNAVRASFTSAERREALLAELDQWTARHGLAGA
jgi:adenosine deaminase